MTELFKMAAGNDGQDLTSDFSKTLDTIFKGFGPPTDNGAGALSVTRDEMELFDFTPFVDEDHAGSKASTPDLVPSSMNPGPKSTFSATKSVRSFSYQRTLVLMSCSW
jgi:hypothetical protein